MKTIHASLKILGKRRTVYSNNEMLSKMVHVGMTVSTGEKKKHVQHVYADIIIFSPSIITTILVLFGSLTSISPCFPCFRCSYNMIKYTFIIIRNLQSVLHHRLTDILIILGQLVPWSESVYLRLHAGLPRQ